MKNWKKFLAAVGTAALIASNMGAVTQVVFASEPSAAETQLAAEKPSSVKENESGKTATDEKTVNEAKDSAGGDAAKETVSGETAEQEFSGTTSSSSAQTSQIKTLTEGSTSEEPATGNDTTSASENSFRQTDAAPAETTEAADTESADAKTVITLRYEVNDEKMGAVVDADGTTVTGDEAAFTPGEAVTFKTVTAKANDGYKFVKWVSGDGDEITTADLTVKFENTADYTENVSKTYKAVFEEKAADQELTYPEEEKSFTASVSGYDVTVQVPAKSFAGEVSLQATAQGWSDLDSDVRKQLEDAGVGENNSQSLDLSFIDSEGNEVEPANEVRVQFTIHNEDALKSASDDNAKLDVYHAEEQKNDNGEVEKVEVKQVASTEDESVTVRSEGEATADFAVESFSTFTITWDYYYSIYAKITVHYVDEKGIEIQGPQTKNVNIQRGQTYQLSEYEGEIPGHEFQGARLESADGIAVTGFKTSQSGNSYNPTYNITFYDGDETVKTYSSTSGWSFTPAKADVYLIYSLTKFNIQDTVSDDGNLNAVFGDGVIQESDRVTYTWSRCETEKGDYQVISRTKATGTEYNIDETGRQLNVVYDHVVAGADASTRYYYKVTATVEHADRSTTEYNAGPYRSPYYFQVQNGSFESPDGTNRNSFMNQTQHTDELVWYTTASDYLIEIVNVATKVHQDGAEANYGEHEAKDGNQFAEINAEKDAALYQSVLTTPGATLYWSLYHEARTKWDNKEHGVQNTDSMFVVVASDEDTSKLTDQGSLHDYILDKTGYSNTNWDNFVSNANADKELSKDSKVSIIKVTSNGDGWQYHSSTNKGYKVPDGQFLTRFFFVAGSCFSNTQNIDSRYKNTIGNLVDNISFNEEVPAPTSGSVNVTVKKIVSGLSDEDLKDYGVEFSINGKSYKIESKDFIHNSDGTWVGTITANVSTGSNDKVGITVNEKSATAKNNYTMTSNEKHKTGNNNSWTEDKKITIGEGDNNGTGEFYVEEKNTAEVVFTNTYEPSTGSLKIVKTLDGTTEYVPDGETYSIDITNESESDTSYAGKTYNADNTEVGASDPNANVQFTAGKATVTLQGGQYVIINGLKVDNEYLVQEQAASGTDKGYTVSYNGDSNAGKATAKITANKNNPATVTIRNSLNVVKTGIRNNGVPFASIVFAADVVVALYVFYGFMKKRFLM